MINLFRKRFTIGTEYNGTIAYFYTQKHYSNIEDVLLCIEYGDFNYNKPCLYDRKTKVLVDGRTRIKEYLSKIKG